MKGTKTEVPKSFNANEKACAWAPSSQNPHPLGPWDITLEPKAGRRGGGQCCLWLAGSPSHLRGSGRPWGWFDGEKHLKSLLSTQAHSGALTAGPGQAVAVGQMGGDRRAFCARTRARPDLAQTSREGGITFLLSVAK